MIAQPALQLWPEGSVAPTEMPHLTPYLPDAPRGAIIVCPGGGYSNRAAHEDRKSVV